MQSRGQSFNLKFVALPQRPRSSSEALCQQLSPPRDAEQCETGAHPAEPCASPKHLRWFVFVPDESSPNFGRYARLLIC
eukprot:m51a1_g7525 hypothetical protein (79) ;mRNA; r:30442-30786